MNYGFAHVIMLNDDVRHVVVEPCDTPANLHQAVEKMHELARTYFAENRWSFHGTISTWSTIPFSPAWCDYLRRCRWHIRTVETS